jgi:hypothetical protein
MGRYAQQARRGRHSSDGDLLVVAPDAGGCTVVNEQGNSTLQYSGDPVPDYGFFLFRYRSSIDDPYWAAESEPVPAQSGPQAVEVDPSWNANIQVEIAWCTEAGVRLSNWSAPVYVQSS